jgi:hypothetical protein
MARPTTLRRPPNGARYDPNSLDAHARTAGDILTVVDDGTGGKRSAWTDAADVTGGNSSGTPGNAVLPFVVESGDGPLVLGAHGTDPELIPCGRIRRNLTATGFLRGQCDVIAAGALTSYVDLGYSLDNGDTIAGYIGLRVPLKEARHAVGFAVAVPEGAVGDVLLIAVVAGGNDSAVPEIQNFIVDATSSTPPTADGEDDPVDTEDPGDLPEGELGTIIWRANAKQVFRTDPQPSTGANAPTWHDLIGFLPGDVDAKTVGADGQGQPIFRLTGFLGGLPCIEYESGDGHQVASQFTADSSTTYTLDSNIGTPASDFGALWNGNVFPWGKGLLLEADGDFGFYYNSSSGFNAYTPVVPDWDRSLPHVYAVVMDRTATPVPRADFYVDGVLKGSVSDSNLSHLTEASAIKWGAYTGVTAFAFKRAEMVVWNAAHTGAQVATASAAILNAWGL